MKMLSKTITCLNTSPMSYDVVTMTVKEFLDNYLKDVDCNPIHQRLDVFNYSVETENRLNPSKRQGIVGSTFKGIDISELKINERTLEERLKYPQRYESIDGGNRKRAIRDFYGDKFPLNKVYNPDIGYKYFKNLTEEERQRFYNFKIRMVIYRHLTPQQKSMIWETTNNSTPVNHQEMLNGMGDIPIANAIREMARLIEPTQPNQYHPLFEIKLQPDGKIVPLNLTFDPNRLTFDRVVARIFVICNNGEKPTPCDDTQIEELYNDPTINENRANLLAKKVREFLDFALNVAVTKRSKLKTKMTDEELTVLYRLFYSYKERWGKFKINDFEQYYEYFYMAYSQFYKKNPTEYGAELIKTYDKKSSEKKMRCTLFWDNLGKRESMKRWSDTVEWMEKNFLVPETLIKLGIITVLDTRRSLPKKDREQLLIRQGGKCYIDGKELTMEDAEAGHIKAYSKSGTTTVDNIVMIRNTHNSQMGTMDIDTYKELWDANKVSA